MRNLTEVQTAQNELILNEGSSGDIKRLFMRRDVLNIQVTTDLWAYDLDLEFDSEKDAYVMENEGVKSGLEMTCSQDMNTGCNFSFVVDFGMKKIITSNEWGADFTRLNYDKVTAVIVQFEDGRTQFINKNFVWSETA